MTGPAWASGAFAALMILVAVTCAGRLIAGRLRRRVTEPGPDLLHLVMGTAMAGMFEPRLSLLPGTAWLAVFTAAAAWFGWRSIRTSGQPGDRLCAHPVPHAVECAAMIYMLLPAATRPPGHEPALTMPGMAGMVRAGGNPAIALVLAIFMLGYLIWTTDQLACLSRAPTASPASSTASKRPLPACTTPGHVTRTNLPANPPGGTDRQSLAPRLAAFSTITMSIAMGYMLLVTL